MQKCKLLEILECISVNLKIYWFYKIMKIHMNLYNKLTWFFSKFLKISYDIVWHVRLLVCVLFVHISFKCLVLREDHTKKIKVLTKSLLSLKCYWINRSNLIQFIHTEIGEYRLWTVCYIIAFTKLCTTKSATD
jgi:hypothetical protein